MKIIFWLSLFIAFYTYVGYGILLFIIVKIKRVIKGRKQVTDLSNDELPTCTLVIAAYNEEGIIRAKIADTLALRYPAGKLKLIFITDGSTD